MSSYSGNRNRRRRRRQRSSLFRLFVLVLILLPLYAAMLLSQISKRKQPSGENQVEQTPQETGQEVTPALSPAPQEEVSQTFLTAADIPLSEENVFTFLQGPKAWNSKTEWSGSWCEEVLGGQKFSVFGCGHCCTANIYSTLTPYICSPVDMFYFTRDNTEYSPTSTYGAVAWEYMQQVLLKTGISSSLRKKDDSYEAFRQNIAQGLSAIALVNSANDSTYWKDVTGHYVNIWLYRAEDDSVFLADSGNPDHNRQRIPLRYVYDALKTADNYQYLLVTGVYPDGNTWQHNGIASDWTTPW